MVAVAFADLAGFTRLGEAFPLKSLSEWRAAYPLVPTKWRLVRSGSSRHSAAVMFVCPEPVSLLKAILALAKRAADEHLPRLRSGVAAGEAVTAFGDMTLGRGARSVVCSAASA